MGNALDSPHSLDMQIKTRTSGSRKGGRWLRRVEIAQWVEAMCEASRDRSKEGKGTPCYRRWWDRAFDVVSLTLFGLIVKFSSTGYNSERLERHTGMNPMNYDMDVLAPIRFRDYLRQQPAKGAKRTMPDALESSIGSTRSESSNLWSISYAVEGLGDLEVENSDSSSESCSTQDIRKFESIKLPSDAKGSRPPQLHSLKEANDDLTLAPVSAQTDNGTEGTQTAQFLQQDHESPQDTKGNGKFSHPHNFLMDAFWIWLKHLPYLVIAAAMFLFSFNAWSDEVRLWGFSMICLYYSMFCCCRALKNATDVAGRMRLELEAMRLAVRVALLAARPPSQSLEGTQLVLESMDRFLDAKASRKH